MPTECLSPTPAQRRLVNIGMFVQFHLAAIGHLVVWLWMFVFMLQATTPFTSPSDEGYDAWFIGSIFVETGIPISFGILVAVYILFRCLLAYVKFGTALIIMISTNIFHAIAMGLLAIIIPFAIIVPVRLAIPVVLYSIACYSYYRTVDNVIREYNEMEQPDGLTD